MRVASVVVGLVVASVSASAALAAPRHLSDVQYIEANRCLGLMTSKALASPDAGALRSYVDREGWSRVPAALDQADEARETAQSAADRSSGYTRMQLQAERDGVCRSFLASTTAAASQPTKSSLQ